MQNTKRTAWESGRDAALRGCYRVLVCAESEQERRDWLRGYDSVPADHRGRWPLSGRVPVELQSLAQPEYTAPKSRPTRRPIPWHKIQRIARLTQSAGGELAETELEEINIARLRSYRIESARDLRSQPLTPSEFLRRPFAKRSRWLVRFYDFAAGRCQTCYVGKRTDLRVALYEPHSPRPTHVFPRPFGDTQAERRLLIKSLGFCQGKDLADFSLGIYCDSLRLVKAS